MSMHKNNPYQPPANTEHSERITREASISWGNIIDLLDYLNCTVDPAVLVDFSIKQIAPAAPSRHMENILAARVLDVTRNTIENWRGATTKCSMPLRLTVAVARKFKGPDDFLAAFSKYTGEDHAAQFAWSVEAS